MRIGLFMPAYNEAYTLDQVLRYYRKQGITEIFLFDNGSTDETREIAMQHDAITLDTRAAGLDDRNYLYIKNDYWKRHRDDFDFIICCDADEVLFHPLGLANALEKETGSIIHPIGWNVYSESAPDKADILKVSTGFPDPNFSKCVCFDPKRIESINYGWGAHGCNPTGDVEYSANDYYLLHVRCLGGAQRMIDRHRAYSERMSEFNRVHGLGFHYLRSDQEIQQEWARNIAKSREADFITHE